MKKSTLILTITFLGTLSFAADKGNTGESDVPLLTKPPIIGIGKESNAKVKQLPLVPTQFNKGTKVEILEYDAEMDVFNVAESGFEEQGPFFITPQEVLKATQFAVDPADFTLQKKKDFVGSEHVLKVDMKMLDEPEYLARKKK